MAMKLGRRFRTDPLGVFAGEIGIAVEGAILDRVSAGEIDIVGLAHRCGCDFFSGVRMLLRSSVDEQGLIEKRSLQDQFSMHVLIDDEMSAPAHTPQRIR